MYQSYYQLDLDPFRLTPDSRFAYPHPAFRAALGSLQMASQLRDGIVVITGRPGTGKTTVCEEFQTWCKVEKHPTTVVVASHFEQGEFLCLVARALQINAEGLVAATLLEQIETALRVRPFSVLIIDEAQNLSEVALHEVQALSDLQRDSQPLLQICLVGQENLTENLSSNEQLQRRITRSNHLGALGVRQTSAYVLHRLGRAGWVGNPSISAEAIVLIHRFSLGLPRHICKLSSRLLTYGVVQGSTNLDRRSVAAVVAELEEEMLMPQPGIEAFPAVAGLQSSVAAGLGTLIELTLEEQEFLADSPVEMTGAPAVSRISGAARKANSAVIPGSFSALSLVRERATTQGGGWWGRLHQYYLYGLIIVALAVTGYFLVHEYSGGPYSSEVDEVLKPIDNPLAQRPQGALAGLPRVLAAQPPQREIESDAAPVMRVVTALDTGQSGRVPIPLAEKIEELLLLGAAALAKNYLTTPDKQSAYHYYSGVLELDPESEAGRSGLQTIIRRYRLMAITMMEKKRYEVAAIFIERGLAIDYASPQLLALQLKNQQAFRQQWLDGVGASDRLRQSGRTGDLEQVFNDQGRDSSSG